MTAEPSAPDSGASFGKISEPTMVVHAPPSVAELAPAKAPGLVKQHSIFREQAIESYLASMRDGAVLRISPPWARGVMIVASLLVFASMAATFVVRVDQTGRARGVLRVAGGAQSVTSQTTGVVLELGGRSGDVVGSGALLAKIDSTATKTALLEAERDIERARDEIARFSARRDKEQAERIRLLEQRVSTLGRRAANQRATVARLAQRLATFDRMLDAGVASSLDRGAAENDLAAGERDFLQLEEEISSTRLQISNIGAELAQELEKRELALKKATDRRDTLAFQLQQTEVRSTHAGRLEALVAKVGDSVAVGTPVARIVPEGAPRQIVVFLPEADRAFLEEGTSVRIELDQLPAGEFGSLRAKVARIATDLAAPSEIAEALGETKLDGPTYRVELVLEDGAANQKLDRLLRPGSLVTARFVLRTRRLATLLFAPLRRFLD